MAGNRTVKEFLLMLAGCALFIAAFFIGRSSVGDAHRGSTRFALHEFVPEQLTGGMVGQVEHRLFKIDQATGQVWELKNMTLNGWGVEGWDAVPGFTENLTYVRSFAGTPPLADPQQLGARKAIAVKSPSPTTAP